MTDIKLDLSLLRSKAAGAHGKQLWRSLDELAETEEFQQLVSREFPSRASELRDPVSRRAFLKVMGASLALAGLTGCSLRQPQEKMVPYVRPPENYVPGQALYFATAMPFGGYGKGVLVESHEGRPTKIEGNPDHPASLGRTDLFMQASVLTMYDQDRSQGILNAGQPATWDAFVAALTTAATAAGTGGSGMRILSETVTSPTLAAQLQAVQTAFPNAQWLQYEPINRDNVRNGAQLAFGSPVETFYQFDQAQVIVSLDADFLFAMPGSVRYAADFAELRRVREDRIEMNRLYVAETGMTITGSMADHRLPVVPSRIEALARALAEALGVEVAAPAVALSEAETRWVEVAAADLQAAGPAAVVVAGDGQPAQVHAIAHALNGALGSVGTTIIYSAPVEANPIDQTAALSQLVNDMRAGQVQLLLMLGGNPVYDAPADLDFGGALGSVPTSVHLSLFRDETSARSSWHVNATHYLEQWGDIRAFDGTVSILQPLIAPLYNGKTELEVLSALLGQPDRLPYEIVRSYWQGQVNQDFETFWETAIHDGFLADTATTPTEVTLGDLAGLPVGTAGSGLELQFLPDPSLWDGRFANNAWLQEVPKPFSKIVWDNAVLLAPATAAELGLNNGDVVELSLGGASVSGSVWVQFGQAPNSATVYLGHGRSAAGQVGNQTGFNAYQLRSSSALWFAPGLQLRGTGAVSALVSTQGHFLIDENIEEREIIRHATLEAFRNNNEVFVIEKEKKKPELSLYPRYSYESTEERLVHAWGMTIDQSICIGCNACVVACQAENNIPSVGKEEVRRGREMHWLRIDTYYGEDLDNPSVYYQPMLCQHCEKAPCEVVCPVGATIHDAEGLNNMVYNRCVGTKYCSNNCPFKVRRFNFLQYTNETDPVRAMVNNPDVTVRVRGVMEKCTFCVQRISAARIVAKRENRRIADGEVVTACQQACPTQAIVFGDLNDPTSVVSLTKAQPSNYTVLAELNVLPRTSYLGKLTNPNAELGGSHTE